MEWPGPLDRAVLHGPDIAPDTPGAERADYGEVVLHGRLRPALARLNPDLPDDALRRLTRPAGAALEARNRDFHRAVVAGVTVEYTEGRVRGGEVRVVDFDAPDGNGWLSVNQFTQETVTVRIPESNVFDVATLQTLMEPSRSGDI